MSIVSAEVAHLFGGLPVLRHPLDNPLDAHEMLVAGLPSEALQHLIDHTELLRSSDLLEKALGVSLRTVQRRKESPQKPLSPEQSGRIWKFAEILAHATKLFGTQSEAERWLDRPAIGLNQRRPIDLRSTPAGGAIVETFLDGIEYGAYM